MQTFLVKVSHHTNFITDSSSRNFMVIYNKKWDYVLRSEPQTLWQALNFIDVILKLVFDNWEAK